MCATSQPDGVRLYQDMMRHGVGYYQDKGEKLLAVDTC